MKTKTLIELLQLLDDDLQNLEVIFEDVKYGQYAIREIWVRTISGHVVLTGNDKAPKEVAGLVEAMRARGEITDGREDRHPEGTVTAEGGSGREDLPEGVRGEDHGEAEELVV